MKILIADDELRFRRLLSDYLKKEGYITLEASNGKEALLMIQNNDLDLVILDVMMPEMNGLNVCKNIRVFTNIPVIILTAKSEEEDQLDAFDVGADDFISKPFSFNILLARINVLLRRNNSNKINLGDIFIDIDAHEAFAKNTLMELTPKEYELLLFFIKNKNNVVSREQILNAVWDYNYFGDFRTVDTHVKNLRSKLNDCDYIKTIRGYGYKMEYKEDL